MFNFPLQIPKGIAVVIAHVVFEVEPKGCNQVQDNGRAHGDKRSVNKVQAYA